MNPVPSPQPAPQSDPKNTIAVLIGVEKYDVGKSWNLNGPANDVMRFSEWLQGKGVPAEHLYFFLSPLDENLPLPAHPQTKPANKSIIFNFLTNELPKLAEQSQCDTLFFFWAGHGSVTGNRQNHLFCSDATENSKLNINLESLLQMAQSRLYAKLKQQIFIIDACANYFELMRYNATLPDDSFPSETPLAMIVQEVLLAAAPGQTTQNDNLRNIGEFSDFLLTTLKKNVHPKLGRQT